ncbi:MAG TPA: hypothetical protein PKH64_06260 [Petrotogaceae bacterium]|jgi:hypothetical protein|nr:hypothetical protein [Petrotogaceae bacterium]HNV05706.1 hypothetical protein [Petrotogaceae bacterium]
MKKIIDFLLKPGILTLVLMAIVLVLVFFMNYNETVLVTTEELINLPYEKRSLFIKELEIQSFLEKNPSDINSMFDLRNIYLSVLKNLNDTEKTKLYNEKLLTMDKKILDTYLVSINNFISSSRVDFEAFSSENNTVMNDIFRFSLNSSIMRELYNQLNWYQKGYFLIICKYYNRLDETILSDFILFARNYVDIDFFNSVMDMVRRGEY